MVAVNQWQRLHGVTPKFLALADINRNATRDVVVDFGTGAGIWQYANDQDWTRVHPSSPAIINARRFE